MPTGLLLDYGGVLTSAVTESFAKFCELEQIDAEIFRRVVLDHARTPESIFAAVEIGRIAQEAFDEQLAALLSAELGRPISPLGLKQRLFAHSTPDDRMLEAVRSSRKQGVRTVLVSNSWGGKDYPVELFDELFDAVVVSGEVGMRKPHSDIYLLAASKIAADPAECVFVDDFEVNVRGAEAVGMTGIHHRDAGTTIARLEELFGVSLAQAGAR